MLKRNASIAAMLCVAAAVTSVAAVAQENDTPPGEGVDQVATIDQDALDALDVLAEPRNTTDALPADVAAAFDENPSFGMNPELSRRSIANTTSSVFVIPAEGHVCMAFTVGDGATVSCPTTDQVAAGETGAGTVLLAEGNIAIYGVVPDEVDQVTLKTGVSTSDEIEVADNAYYTVVQAGTVLRTVSYTGPSGPVEFPIYDPSLSFEDE